MSFAVDIWPRLSLVVISLISLLAIVSNGLTLLAMRKRYGLRKMLGTTSFLLVSCLSLMHLINGLYGIPITAVDRVLEENWPPRTSQISVSTTCIITMLPGIILYNSALWYLLSIAIVRFALVFWPHRAKRILESRVSWVLACVVPFLMGLFPTTFGFVTKALAFGKVQNHCAPIAYDDVTPEGIMRMQIYQFVTLVWSLVLPVPTSFALYLAMGIKLYLQQRAKKRRIGANGGLVVPSVYSVHSAARARQIQSNQTNETLHTEALVRSSIAAKQHSDISNNVSPVATAAGPTDQQQSLELLPLRREASSTLSPAETNKITNVQSMPRKVVKKQTRELAAHQRKYRVVRMLAYAYIVNILCISPVYVLWMTGFYYNLEPYSANAMFAEAVNWLYLFAAPMDSIMYAAVSTDFRRAYKRIICCR